MTTANIFNPSTGQTGYQVPGAAPPPGWVAGTGPATLVKDPSTGSFSSQGGTTAPNMVPVTSSPTGGASVGLAPKSSDPYTQFNMNIADILKQIQGAQVTGKANLTGAKDFLTTESVNPNNSTFNPGVFSGSQVQGQQALQAGFNPAVTSISDQMANTDAALGNLRSDIGTLATAYQPQALSAGQSLVGKDGAILARTPDYLPPQIRPDTGQLDSFDQANGVWKSDVRSASSDSSGGTSNVAGVDLAKYNPADPQYSNKVGSIYQTLSTSMPQPSADGLDTYIAGHGGKAPVTGQMIMQVSQQYGLDPNLLAAQLALESDFGNAGEAPKNFNPGGVVFVGQPGATQGSPRPANEGGYYAKFSSWMQGLNAMAEVVAKSKGTSTSNPTSPSTILSGLSPAVQKDAQDLATGNLAPQVLSDRYTAAYGKDGGALYNIAIQAAKKLNPAFDETKANLAYEGQKTQTQNINSGNPVTSIFSNLKNALTTPASLSIFNPSNSSAGSSYMGIKLPN